MAVAQPKSPYYIFPNLVGLVDLTLVATAIIAEGFRLVIEKVASDPSRLGEKIYYIGPKEEAIRFELAYQSGQIRVDPSLLNAKRAALKYLPVSDNLPRDLINDPALSEVAKVFSDNRGVLGMPHNEADPSKLVQKGNYLVPPPPKAPSNVQSFPKGD